MLQAGEMIGSELRELGARHNPNPLNCATLSVFVPSFPQGSSGKEKSACSMRFQ